uniref:Uncharacterized protein n=1 Tax=viral metagenome TaxID=1070528 RepID=A0A6M3IIK3_9ZZZZ
MIRKPIHTTLSESCHSWIHQEAENIDKTKGQIIDMAIDFYKNNNELLIEYNQAKVFLKELVKSEILENYLKAKPLLQRIVREEMDKNKE